jgi:hypothetical protein
MLFNLLIGILGAIYCAPTNTPVLIVKIFNENYLLKPEN